MVKYRIVECTKGDELWFRVDKKVLLFFWKEDTTWMNLKYARDRIAEMLRESTRPKEKLVEVYRTE